MRVTCVSCTYFRYKSLTEWHILKHYKNTYLNLYIIFYNNFSYIYRSELEVLLSTESIIHQRNPIIITLSFLFLY